MLSVLVVCLNRHQSVYGGCAFDRDQTHIHHRLIDAGLSRLQALTALVFAAIGYFWIGFFVTINYGNTASVIAFGIAILSMLRLPATSVYLVKLATRS